MTQGQFFKQSLTGLNSEFSFSYTICITKADEPRLPHYLPIAGGRIIGFIIFPRVLVLCEMQSVLSWIWTRVAESIFCEDNHYTTGTFTSLIYIHKKDLALNKYHKTLPTNCHLGIKWETTTWTPIASNENGKPSDSINWDNMLLEWKTEGFYERKTSVIAWPVHSHSKAIL